MSILDVGSQDFVGVKLGSAEGTHSGFGWYAHVCAEVYPQVIFVLVGSGTQMALERASIGVHWKMLMVL